ncbi:MAG TPA: hypothetical protein VF284_12875 [Rhodanobacteraceae bacterium]
MTTQAPADVIPNAPRRWRLASIVRPRVARWCAFALMAAVVAMVLIAAADGPSRNLLAWLGPMVAVIAGFGTAGGIFPLPPRDALDEAWLDGDELLLRRGDQSVRLPLAHVDSVDVNNSRNLVILGMKTPCILGGLIRFRTRPRKAREVCVDLRQRIRSLPAASE